MMRFLNKVFGISGIKKKLLIALISLAVLPFSVAGLYGVYYSVGVLEDTTLRHLEYELSSKAEDIEKFLKTVHRDALFLSQTVVMRDILDSKEIHGTKEFHHLRKRLEQVIFIISQTRPYYYQIRYIEENGREVVRVDSDGKTSTAISFDKLQDKGDRYYFKEAMKYPRWVCYVSPMDLNIERGEIELPHKPVVRVATTVFDSLGNKRGIVIINLYASYLIQQMQRMNIAKGGTTFLVNRDGFYLSRLNSQMSDSQSFNLGSTESLSKDFSQETVNKILSGTSGTIKNVSEIISYFPILTGDAISKEFWVLVIVYPKKAIFASVLKLEIVYVTIGLIALCVAFIIGLWMARRFTKPIIELHQGVEWIASGDFEHTLNIKTGDEIEGLAAHFNGMTLKLKDFSDKTLHWNRFLQEEVTKRTRELEMEKNKLENIITEMQRLTEERMTMERQLFHADKLVSLGELSAGIAHEIGNPLAAIKTVIQAMDEETPFAEEQREYMKRILKEVDRLAAFLKTFSAFAHPSINQSARCRVDSVLKDVIFLVRNEAQKHNIEIDYMMRKDTPEVIIDSDQLKQIFINLILNAIQAMQDGGKIAVSIENLDGKGVKISVSDTGPGIPQEIIGKIFDPFFTTKPSGTGLGLAIVHRIINEHKGEIEVKSEVGKGTIFTVNLPVDNPPGDRF
ncbi:MAG: HAMP domain-containing protein [Deltaproteobacteria bacterium]|nr:HAMP domain-containing protein [Deltaproteobacteria bacterium]